MMMRGVMLCGILMVSACACPFLQSMNMASTMPNPHKSQRRLKAVGAAEYDVGRVMADIANVLKHDAADGGPQHFPDPLGGGNYGPNFIRLAWHCAGTYRISDGHGGCDGARIRFPPESEWGDNKGLINPDDDGRGATIEVLRPIKEGYPKLSWSDLIVLAGNTAIREMGGPEVEFCGGQKDDDTGADSVPLDTSLIYVDAGAATAAEVRTAFARMGMDDTETIALIAGGHTFGRCHKGRSGFEGAWTATPSQWSTQYLSNLLNLNWTRANSSKGLPQFRVDSSGDTSDDDLMMLVADFNLKADKTYRAILQSFLDNPEDFKTAFGKAWRKLMQGGRADVCTPRSTTYSYNVAEVKADITKALSSCADANVAADGGFLHFSSSAGGHFGPNMIRLAWHCAGTYRRTDGLGGCDGARIRFPPESNWGDNKGLISADDAGRGATLEILRPIKDKYGPKLSWADLIVLAGDTAIEDMGGPKIAFCGGRTDDADGRASIPLNSSMIYVDAGAATANETRAAFAKMGMDDRETVALIAGGHTFGRCHAGRSGFEGAWTATPSQWSMQYLSNLLNLNWTQATSSKGLPQFRVDSPGDTSDDDLMMLVADFNLRKDAVYIRILQSFLDNPDDFKDAFGNAWAKLMNGGREHVCGSGSPGAGSPGVPDSATARLAGAAPFLLALFTLHVHWMTPAR